MNICPMCEEGTLTPSIYTGTIVRNSEIIEVVELECYICNECEATPVSREQAERNQKRYQNAKEIHRYNVSNTVV